MSILEAVLTSKFILMGLPFISCVNSCYLVVCKIQFHVKILFTACFATKFAFENYTGHWKIIQKVIVTSQQHFNNNFSNTVESHFFKAPRDTKIGRKTGSARNQRQNYMNEGMEIDFGSSSLSGSLKQNEDLRNWDFHCIYCTCT